MQQFNYLYHKVVMMKIMEVKIYCVLYVNEKYKFKSYQKRQKQKQTKNTKNKKIIHINSNIIINLKDPK